MYTRFKSIPRYHEWEQSCRVKKFCRAFTNYNLLLCALDVSCIYVSVSRCVAPPKSGEDAHVTCGMCDLGGPTLYQPRLGFSYILPRLWDPGGVRSTPNVPMMNLDQSRSLGASRYPYTPCKGHLVSLTSQQQWQHLHMFHVKLNIFIHRNTTEFNTAMTKFTGNISANIPKLMRPTPTHYELCFLHVAHACPYDRQSSHMALTVTATSYIQVIKKLDLCMETISPNEGHTSHPSFS